MLSYHMDHHVPLAITNGLCRKGIACLTATDDGARQWDDTRLLQRATQLGRILVSQDVDLLVIAVDCQRRDIEFAGLIFGRQVQLTVGQAIRDLELIACVLTAAEMRNNVVHIPL